MTDLNTKPDGECKFCHGCGDLYDPFEESHVGHVLAGKNLCRAATNAGEYGHLSCQLYEGHSSLYHVSVSAGGVKVQWYV